MATWRKLRLYLSHFAHEELFEETIIQAITFILVALSDFLDLMRKSWRCCVKAKRRLSNSWEELMLKGRPLSNATVNVEGFDEFSITLAKAEHSAYLKVIRRLIGTEKETLASFFFLLTSEDYDRGIVCFRVVVWGRALGGLPFSCPFFLDWNRVSSLKR